MQPCLIRNLNIFGVILARYKILHNNNALLGFLIALNLFREYDNRAMVMVSKCGLIAVCGRVRMAFGMGKPGTSVSGRRVHQ
jgi:uncharacterized membrane protein YecN with MAPEG domain